MSLVRVFVCFALFVWRVSVSVCSFVGDVQCMTSKGWQVWLMEVKPTMSVKRMVTCGRGEPVGVSERECARDRARVGVRECAGVGAGAWMYAHSPHLLVHPGENAAEVPHRKGLQPLDVVHLLELASIRPLL